MHYGTNQKLGGQDLGGGLCSPGPSLKPPLHEFIVVNDQITTSAFHKVVQQQY